MRDGDLDRNPDGRRGEAVFIVSCAAVFVVIASCAAYFIIRLLA